MKKVITLVLLILVLGVLAGCVTIDQARTNYCQSLGEFGVAVVNMRQINDTSSMEEVDDAKEEVKKAWDEVKDSVGNLADAQYDALEEAVEEFEEAIDDIPRDATLAEAKATVHEAALNLAANYVAIATTTCEYPQAQQMVIQQPQQ